MAPAQIQTLAEILAKHAQQQPAALQAAPSTLKDPQEIINDLNKPMNDKVQLIPSQKRRHGGFGFVAMMNGYVYHCDYQREGSAGARVYWKCTQRGGCGARLITDKNGNVLNARNNYHSHPPVDEQQNDGVAKLVEEKEEQLNLGSRRQNYQANLAFVKEIRKRRHVLFGPHERLNHADVVAAKERAWEEIREAVVQQGHAKFVGKDWRQLRANEWQQVRRASMAKRYLNEVSGSKAQLNELDQIVLDLVGSETGADAVDAAALDTTSTTSTLNGLINKAIEEEQSSATTSPVSSLATGALPSADLFTSLFSQLDPAALQQLAQSQNLLTTASSTSTTTTSRERAVDESGGKRFKSEDNADAMHCSPSSSFEDAVDQQDVNIDVSAERRRGQILQDLKLHYTREQFRLSIARERAKLDLAHAQLQHANELHELRVQSERCRLEYEQLRLKNAKEPNLNADE